MKRKTSPEYSALLQAIRAILKKQKITYADLASRIKVSEATVKRIFTSHDAAFSRIIEICAAIGISFSDLVQESQERKESVFSLSEEQEQFFAKNPNYFGYFNELFHSTPQEIQSRKNLTSRSTAKYLKKLDEMKLIDWLPSNRIALKVQGTQNWLHGGPLQKQFIQEDNISFIKYLNQQVGKEKHFFTTSDRLIHPETLQSFLVEQRALTQEYRKRAYRDEVCYPRNALLQAKWLFGIAPYAKDWSLYIKNL